MQPDIICIGEPMLEFNQVRGEQTYLPGHGGDTSNCAVAAARQGASVGYWTALGADQFGDSFMQLWQDEGVDCSHVLRNPDAHTGIYFITHTDAGHSFSYRRTGSAASRMRPEDLPEAYIAGAKILHVSGISQAISDSACDTVFRAIEIARENEVEISYDPNLRLKLWPLTRARAIVHATMAMADYALPGLEDAQALTGHTEPEEIVAHYLEMGAGVVALTLGEEGTLVATEHEKMRMPARVVKAVDATGAGDTFDGAFLAEVSAGSDPFAAAAYANVAAALSTQGYGAVAPMPRRADVEAAMAENSPGTIG